MPKKKALTLSGWVDLSGPVSEDPIPAIDMKKLISDQNPWIDLRMAPDWTGSPNIAPKGHKWLGEGKIERTMPEAVPKVQESPWTKMRTQINKELDTLPKDDAQELEKVLYGIPEENRIQVLDRIRSEFGILKSKGVFPKSKSTLPTENELDEMDKLIQANPEILNPDVKYFPPQKIR